MKQVTALTSTYSSDVFGICSALYELGGMVVMHDASGCNSTYTTHDEPRWYDMDSMIYVSAISEREAILGNDEKLIDDLAATAEKLHPKFIAIVLAPIPYMIGTDAAAIARIGTERCGIPCFGFSANGMHDYTRGVSDALETLVRTFSSDVEGAKNLGQSVSAKMIGKSSAYGSVAGSPVGNNSPSASKDNLCSERNGTVNLLGVTPLDFGINGSVAALRQWVADHGMENGTCLAMGCTLNDIAAMPNAQMNLVVSTGGFAAARWMEERFGIPYVVGVPYGNEYAEKLASVVHRAAVSGASGIAYRQEETVAGDTNGIQDTIGNGPKGNAENNKAEKCVLIGEAVTASSLAAAIKWEYGLRVRVLCPLETEPELLRPGDLFTPEEDDLMREIAKADIVIADPLYRPLCAGKTFYPLPHPAFSGRMYEKEMPNLIARKLG